METVFVVVRARNGQGLSPPSPLSKPMKTLADRETEEGSTDPRIVRQKLAKRVMELKEAKVVGARKVKLEWEVRKAQPFYCSRWRQINVIVSAVTLLIEQTRPRTIY